MLQITLSHEYLQVQVTYDILHDAYLQKPVLMIWESIQKIKKRDYIYAYTDYIEDICSSALFTIYIGLHYSLPPRIIGKNATIGSYLL